MKIYKTKTGQPYIKLKNGRAKFIKRSKSRTKKSSSRAISTKKTRFKTMAKKKTYRKTQSFFGNLNKPIIGAAGVVMYESLISPMIPLQGTAKDLLELVGGLYLSKKQGFLGATGKSLIVLNSYQLISGLVGNKLQGLIGSSPTNEYAYGGEY